jgi:hypothetical protein
VTGRIVVAQRTQLRGLGISTLIALSDLARNFLSLFGVGGPTRTLTTRRAPLVNHGLFRQQIEEGHPERIRSTPEVNLPVIGGLDRHKHAHRALVITAGGKHLGS